MNEAPPRVIYIIRHGEKPPDSPPPNGVDITGASSDHSLIPPGWQRAGALAALFAPFGGNPRSGLMTPGQLISPDYGDPTSTAGHRTYETIEPLSLLTGVGIETPYPEGQEHELGERVAEVRTGVTLICWEHTALHEIANRITPLDAAATIPQTWPEPRFDVIFAFTWDGSQYDFTQVPQMLLHGDVDAPICA